MESLPVGGPRDGRKTQGDQSWELVNKNLNWEERERTDFNWRLLLLSDPSDNDLGRRFLTFSSKFLEKRQLMADWENVLIIGLSPGGRRGRGGPGDPWLGQWWIQ